MWEFAKYRAYIFPYYVKGKSHLASVRIHQKNSYPTRKQYYDDKYDKIKNDVKYLSYYSKNKLAANDIDFESGKTYKYISSVLIHIK